MNNSRANSGLSRVEVICIVGISAFVAAGVIFLAAYMLGLFQKGDDANTMNTAESVAYTQLTASCMVPGCSGEGTDHETYHFDANGNNFAYYDKVANTLTGVRPQGYNEGTTLRIDGVEQSVSPNTMVIVARCKPGMQDVTLSWESEVSLLAK